MSGDGQWPCGPTQGSLALEEWELGKGARFSPSLAQAEQLS